MKRLLIIGIILFGMNGFGQENQIIKGGNYYISNAVATSNFVINSSLSTKQNSESLKNSDYILTVKGIEDDVVYFKFWNFATTEKNNEINGENKDVIYNMSLKDFKKATAVYYNKIEWKVGVFTVPFKLRFSDFNFESNVNIGTNIGAKIRWDRRKEKGLAIEPLIGIGLSAITLNADNSTIENTSNLSAFSINGGLIFHITDNINLGAILGFDYLSGNDQNKYNWIHNGNGWLGLGVNIAFSTGTQNSGQAQN
jgi:hypothetical protein